MRGLFDRDPGELDQLGVWTDHTLDLVRNRRSIGSEEPGVEAARPPWRGDGAGDEMEVAEVGVDVRFGELSPNLAGRLRRRVALDAEQEPGFLGHLAHGSEREGAGIVWAGR